MSVGVMKDCVVLCHLGEDIILIFLLKKGKPRENEL